MLSELNITEIFACLKYSKSSCVFNYCGWRKARHAQKSYEKLFPDFFVIAAGKRLKTSSITARIRSVCEPSQ